MQIGRLIETVKSDYRWILRVKSVEEIKESLAEKAEPILGVKPSSKFKRGPIGILIYVVCRIIAFF